MLEEELKFDVDESFSLPFIERLEEGSRKRLDATYYDTADLRLARAGATFRYRVGDDEPWTVKLPTEVPGVRHEISVAAARTRPPADLVWLVASLTRGAALRRVAVLRSDRRVYTVDGVEIADDRVVSGTMRFREVEVERKDGSPKLLSALEGQLIAAGASPAAASSKLARVLGESAARPPDRVSAEKAAPTGPRALLRQAIRRGVQRILWHDPLVRLGELLPDGDTPVHQMRVGCRRLRSDLRTFGRLLEREWCDRLRRELRWLAGLLGDARDAEVLRARLGSTAGRDPVVPMDATAIAVMDGRLAERQAQALLALREGMRTKRYLAVVEALTTATRVQPFTGRTSPALGDTGAERRARELQAGDPDERWHRVRILAKRERYAAEAVGDRRRARMFARWQDLLGEHQDAAVAGQTWLAFATDPELAVTPLAVTAGRLFERERAVIREVRAEFLRRLESEAADRHKES